MRKLLLLTGDLATGKSTFAHILSRRYDTPLFFKDAIKEVLGDTIGFADRAENKKLSVAAVEVMGLIFSEFGALGKDLILEANFRTAELEKLHKLAETHRYQVLTLVFRSDVSLLHQRYLHRIRHENRHRVHLITTFDIFEDFCAYIEEGRAEAIPGSALHIRADDFSYQTDPALLAKIDAFMGR